LQLESPRIDPTAGSLPAGLRQRTSSVGRMGAMRGVVLLELPHFPLQVPAIPK
jgi:hypothetical protein